MKSVIQNNKIKTLKNSYSKLKERFTHIISKEDAQEKYLTKILDEAIEEFERSGRHTTSFEDWIEEVREEFGIVL